MSTKDPKLWFSHDADAAADPKTVALLGKYDMAGYGRWWRLCEVLRLQTGYRYDISSKFAYSSLANYLRLTIDEATQFIHDCVNEFLLLKSDGTYIWSDSLCERMQNWEDTKERNRERARKAAENRWNKNHEEQKPKEIAPPLIDVVKQQREMYAAISDKNKKVINSFIAQYKPEFIEPYVDFWNLLADEKELPAVKTITTTREHHLKKRLSEKSFDFRAILGKISQSNFLINEMRVTFDWVVSSKNNYVKILEGNYDNKELKKPVTEHQPAGADAELMEIINKKSR